MSADKRQKPVRFNRPAIWFAYLSSIIAGFIAAIGVYTLADEIRERRYLFDPYFQDPLAYLSAIYPIVIALFVLGFASRRLGWKTTRTFIVSLVVFFSVPYLWIIYVTFFATERHDYTRMSMETILYSLTDTLISKGEIPVRLSKCKANVGFVLNEFIEDTDYDATNLAIFGNDWDGFRKLQHSSYEHKYALAMNIATGYECGRDYFEWWNCFPAKKHLDEKSVAIRKIMAGNFVYIPLDANGNMLPYDADSESTTSAVLCGFGPSNRNGKDIWTPTGDPNKPVTLKADGIPDGVIIMLPLCPEKEGAE